jgi:hypothetical protein
LVVDNGVGAEGWDADPVLETWDGELLDIWLLVEFADELADETEPPE